MSGRLSINEGHQSDMKRSVWTLVSPKPPPRHGASRAVEILLAGPTPSLTWKHVDASYTDSIAELQKLTPRKLYLLVQYLVQMVNFGLKSDGLVLTPSFQANTLFKDSLFIWAAKIIVRKPIVAWYHMRFEVLGFSRLGKLKEWYFEKTLKSINFHVCVAPSLLNGMPKFLDSKKIHVVANGIPALAVVHGQTEKSKDFVDILYVSNFSENKGWRLLLRVATRLCIKSEKIRFHFYGAPTRECSQSELETTFSNSSYPDRILYRGILGEVDKARVFDEADILAFPSFNEAFPITLLEAMSVGLPIVATDVGGIPDAIIDGNGGFLVPAKDEEAFLIALESLCENPELRLRFGNFNREEFEKKFTNQVFCGMWDRLLKGFP